MSEQLAGSAKSAGPKPGGQSGRINVSQTLEDLASKDRTQQIADLEKVHQELTTRLNRAQA